MMPFASSLQQTSFPSFFLCFITFLRLIFIKKGYFRTCTSIISVKLLISLWGGKEICLCKKKLTITMTVHKFHKPYCISHYCLYFLSMLHSIESGSFNSQWPHFATRALWSSWRVQGWSRLLSR